MATGDPMRLCPDCGKFYYMNNGHDCSILRTYGSVNPIGTVALLSPPCPNCRDVESGMEVLVDQKSCCTRCGEWVGDTQLMAGKPVQVKKVCVSDLVIGETFLREEAHDYSGKPDAYGKLRSVLKEAVLQASEGKGKERHAVDGEAFENQQICEITRRLSMSPVAGALSQVVKKVYESSRLPRDRAIAELRGAINYIAAAIIVLEEQKTENT